MRSIAQTAAAVQGLLTTTAEEVGQACHLIRRRRKFTASSLLSTFVLGFLQRPCPTWEQLALVARQCGASVSPQAVEQRITAPLRDGLRSLWQAAVGTVVTAEPRSLPLLAKFTHVLIGDSTTIRLADAPADAFPGCGGSHGFGRAAAKPQVVWDWLSGGVWHASWEAGRQNDSTSPALQAPPPAGSLSLLDLGYFSLERFAAWRSAEAHWISRAVSDLLVWADGRPHDLYAWLPARPAGPVDRWVEAGQARLPCRLVALRAPEEVAARRRQKARAKAARKGRRPTARHLATCDWTVFLTSCPEGLLTWKDVVVLYRVRWQIELLFKLWKSHNLLARHRSSDPVRQLVELYARSVAAILQHWLVLTTAWPDERPGRTSA